MPNPGSLEIHSNPTWNKVHRYTDSPDALSNSIHPITPFILSDLQIDEGQANKIMSLIETGRKQGAKLVSGGTRIGDKGYFVAPTVFANVTDDMTIAKEEVNNTRLFNLWAIDNSMRNATTFIADLWTSTTNFEI